MQVREGGEVKGKRKPVIRRDGEDAVCQRCLVKWARTSVLDLVYCVACGNAEKAKQEVKAK